MLGLIVVLSVCGAEPKLPKSREPKEFLTLMEKSPREYKLSEWKEDSAQWRQQNLWSWYPKLAEPAFVADVEEVNGKRRLIDRRPAPEVMKEIVALEAMFEAKDFALGEKRYAALAAKYPKEYLVQLYWGDVALFDHRPEVALTRYVAAGKLAPVDYRSWLFRGNALRALGRLDEATTAYAHALTLRPHLALAEQILDGAGSQLGVRLSEQPFLPPVRLTPTSAGARLDLAQPTPHWMAWTFCKSVWALEPSARQAALGTELHSPNSIEERECLINFLATWLSKKQGTDAAADFVDRVQKAGLLGEFIVYELLARQLPDVTVTLPEAARARIEEYVKRFVLVPAAPK
jgi:tetratricopeptide (TPR) repeat protein